MSVMFGSLQLSRIPQSIFLAESDMRIKSKEESIHQQLQINTCHCFPAGGMLPTLITRIRPLCENTSRISKLELKPNTEFCTEIKTSNAAFIGLIE